LELVFDTNKLAKQCSTAKERTKAFGTERAKRLGRRLSTLQGAVCLEDLRNTAGRLHVLKGDRAGQLSLDLDGPYRLIFESPVGQNDWSKVTVVRVLGIEDTHE
jgi:plasmid maintenance system killer protein